MSPELSRRVAKVMHTGIIQELSEEEHIKFITEVGHASSFESLGAETQSLIIRAENWEETDNGVGYNPNRDEKTGRFTFGDGSSSSKSFSTDPSFFEQYNDFKQPPTGNNNDDSRSFFLERVIGDLGQASKPKKVSKVENPIYRGWKDPKHVESYINDDKTRMSQGISGSGVYFTSDLEEAQTYSFDPAKGKRMVLTTFGLSKNARGIDSEILRAAQRMDRAKTVEKIQKQIDTARDNRDVAAFKKAQATLKTSDKIYYDLGVYAALNGYDYINVDLGYRDHVVVVNRGALEYEG